MKKILIFVIGMACMVYIAAPACASINIDDGAVEWLDWTGTSSFLEDTNREYFVGPGFGGQRYDVELLALRNTGNRLYFALQTGFDAVDGNRRYPAGDLAIDLGDGDLWSVGLSFNKDNTYDLFSELSYIEGSVTDDWDNPRPLWNATKYKPLKVKDTVASIGNFDAVVHSAITDAFGNCTNLWEGYIDSDVLGIAGFDCVSAYWTMGCGNDYGVVENTRPVVPEPSMMVMLGMGVLGVWLKRKNA